MSPDRLESEYEKNFNLTGQENITPFASETKIKIQGVWNFFSSKSPRWGPGINFIFSFKKLEKKNSKWHIVQGSRPLKVRNHCVVCPSTNSLDGTTAWRMAAMWRSPMCISILSLVAKHGLGYIITRRWVCGNRIFQKIYILPPVPPHILGAFSCQKDNNSKPPKLENPFVSSIFCHISSSTTNSLPVCRSSCFCW